jgi:hypothetical protein
VLRKYCFIYPKIKSMEIYMHNLNKITKILGASLVLVASNAALGQETLSVPTTVTVDNTIDFTLAGTLDFGIIRATGNSDGTNCAGLVISANPAVANTTTLGNTAASNCASSNDAVIQSIGGVVARPVFTVAGLAGFTSLELTLPVAATDLTLTGGAPAGAPVFKLLDLTAYQTTGTAAFVSNGGTITANGTGDITFNVGGTLVTDTETFTSTLTYENSSYEGTFDVTVAYP